VAYGGSAPAYGAPSHCGSIAGGAGPPCGGGAPLAYFCTAHSGAHIAIMLKAAGLDNREIREWWIVRYGQDGNYPAGAGVADGCDPTVYTCFFNGEAEGSLARVP